jgi:hypothetical protein
MGSVHTICYDLEYGDLSPFAPMIYETDSFLTASHGLEYGDRVALRTDDL